MIERFQHITQDIQGFTHEELALHACEGGAKWIQLRVKNKTQEEWLQIALRTQQVCTKYKAKLIINDNVEIAKRIGADGVHLGKEDMRPGEARRILGKDIIIGGSTNCIEDVRRMRSEGVDYVGVGPFRFTSTKEKLNPVLGIGGIRAIAEQCRAEKIDLPLIAIGGIRAEDVEALLDAGVYGVAVSSAVNKAFKGSVSATQDFVKIIQEKVSRLLTT